MSGNAEVYDIPYIDRNRIVFVDDADLGIEPNLMPTITLKDYWDVLFGKRNVFRGQPLTRDIAIKSACYKRILSHVKG